MVDGRPSSSGAVGTVVNGAIAVLASRSINAPFIRLTTLLDVGGVQLPTARTTSSRSPSALARIGIITALALTLG